MNDQLKQYGPKYPKINSIFKRDDKGKIIVNQFADPIFELLSSILWSCTEKVDGMNIRVHWNGENVSFAGRTDNSMLPTPLFTRLTQLFSEDIFYERFGSLPVTFYGEGFGEGIQSGGRYRPGCVDFILFDILADNEYWLPRHELVREATAFGIQVVPIVMIDTLPNCIDKVREGMFSSIAEQTRLSDGLVLKPNVGLRDMNGGRIITKLKTKDFATLG